MDTPTIRTAPHLAGRGDQARATAVAVGRVVGEPGVQLAGIGRCGGRQDPASAAQVVVAVGDWSGPAGAPWARLGVLPYVGPAPGGAGPRGRGPAAGGRLPQNAPALGVVRPRARRRRHAGRVRKKYPLRPRRNTRRSYSADVRFTQDCLLFDPALP
jgi:hypothetical protein